MANNSYQDKTPRNIFFVFVGIFLMIIFLVIIFGSVYTVKSGERGILLTFGKADDIVKEEGLGFKFPIIQKIVKMEVRTQKYEADASAASNDMQVVSTKIAINYHIVPEEVPRIFKELGLGYSERVIQPAVQEVVKSSTSKFKAEELIQKRENAKEDMKTQLKERLEKRGLIIEDISITNFDFSEEYNKAIEAKATAEQLKLKAERDLERIEIEAKQKIAQAQAEAESLRLQKLEVTDNLIKLRQIEVQKSAIDKWNGIMPQVTGGALPFIGIQPSVSEQ